MLKIADTFSEIANVSIFSNRQWTHIQRYWGLTPRERQIAELVCKGLKNGHIAKNLKIRPGTVKTHTRNIYRKIRVRSKILMLLVFKAYIDKFNRHM